MPGVPPDVDSHDLADYLDAFARGLLDPDECVRSWRQAYASACENFTRLAALDVSGFDPPDVEATYAGGRQLIAYAYAQLQAAEYRRSVWRRHRQPPSRPARGLAVCPLCTDEAIVRPRCWLCGGLGYVGREQRNSWKDGQR